MAAPGRNRRCRMFPSRASGRVGGAETVAILKLGGAEHGLLRNLRSFRFYPRPLWAELRPKQRRCGGGSAIGVFGSGGYACGVRIL